MKVATVAIALLACQASAGAQTPSAIGALDFLVGSCWSGQLPRGETDTHCFSRSLVHFVRDVHEVSGSAKPYAGETLYHWDARDAVVRFTYWNSDGGVSTGTMRVQDGALTFPESYEGKDGRRIEMRSVWTRDGADGYVARTEIRKGDAWVEQFRVVFKRTSKSR